jgi:hypothetical protein
VDILGFDEGLLTYIEVGSGSPLAICRTLVAFLSSCKLTAEFRMEFVEVNNELVSTL